MKVSDGPSAHGFEYSFMSITGIQNSPFAFFENDVLVDADAATYWAPGVHADAEGVTVIRAAGAIRFF